MEGERHLAQLHICDTASSSHDMNSEQLCQEGFRMSRRRMDHSAVRILPSSFVAFFRPVLLQLVPIGLPVHFALPGINVFIHY